MSWGARMALSLGILSRLIAGSPVAVVPGVTSTATGLPLCVRSSRVRRNTLHVTSDVYRL